MLFRANSLSSREYSVVVGTWEVFFKTQTRLIFPIVGFCDVSAATIRRFNKCLATERGATFLDTTIDAMNLADERKRISKSAPEYRCPFLKSSPIIRRESLSLFLNIELISKPIAIQRCGKFEQKTVQPREQYLYIATEDKPFYVEFPASTMRSGLFDN